MQATVALQPNEGTFIMKIVATTLAAALALGALSAPALAMSAGDAQLRGTVSQSVRGYGISAADVDALSRGDLARLKLILSSGDSEGQIRIHARTLIEKAS